MKKIIAVIAVAVLVALLPLLGNKAVQNVIEDRLTSLQKEGLAFKLKKEEKSYLKTRLSYTVTVQDEEKFVRYLQEFSSKQLPAYTKSLVDGVEFGVDVEYGNIPMSEKLVVEFYPTKFSDTTMQSLQQNDPQMHKLVSKLLKTKALFYHVEYDVTNNEFDGYMKDLDENFTIDGKTKVHFAFKGAKANGKGQLLAPDRFASHVDTITMNLNENNETLDFAVKNFSSVGSFESKTTYVSSSAIDKLQFRFSGLQNSKPTKAAADIEKFSAEASSDTQGDDAAFYLKSSLKKANITENSKRYYVEDFRFDGALEGVEKESFLKLQKILQEQNQNIQQKEIEKAIATIFSHGAKLKIAQLSVAKLATPQTQKIDGFTASLDAKLQPDPNFAKKLQTDPNAFANNLHAKSKLDFSKEFYAYINTLYPLDLMFAKYKKEKNEHILYNIEFDSGVFKINGTQVK